MAAYVYKAERRDNGFKKEREEGLEWREQSKEGKKGLRREEVNCWGNGVILVSR